MGYEGQVSSRTGPLTGLGLRARKGGAVVVGVTVEAREPRVLVSTILASSADGDRLSFEPCRVAVEMRPQGKATPEKANLVAEGRRRQDQLAAKGLREILSQLEEAGRKPAAAAPLVNRAGWITDLLEHSLIWPDDHLPVVEALAVRDALRFAFRHSGIAAIELDEKFLSDVAAKTLGMPKAEIDARLKKLGGTVAKPWRKEQKLACLSAWLAVAGQR
jgi:hypothetical protein